jgi:multidrug efflux system membrane fusion protein
MEISPETPESRLPAAQAAELSRRPSRLHWYWLIAVLLAVGTYYRWPRATVVSPPVIAAAKRAVTPVIAARARKGAIGVYLTGLGTVTPVFTVTVKSRVDGQLMKVQFKEGDLVHEGDLLVEIDPRPFQVQLDQAEGQLMKDQATLENARVDMARYEGLLKQNAIQEQLYATQKATVKQAEGVVKTDQAQVENAKLNLIYCQITAPISGRVGLRLVDPGNIVHATDSTGLLVITQIHPISVIFTIPEDQLPAVLPKLRAGEHLRVDAFDRELKTKIATGILATVDNQIDPTTGTLRLRANFENRAISWNMRSPF